MSSNRPEITAALCKAPAVAEAVALREPSLAGGGAERAGSTAKGMIAPMTGEDAGRLQRALDAALADHAAAARRAARLDGALRAAGEDLAAARRDIEAAKSEAQARGMALEAARQDLLQLQNSLLVARGEGIAAQEEAARRNAWLTAEIHRLEAAGRAMADALAVVAAQAARSEAQLAAVLASTSWQLTRPVRSVLGGRPGLARLLRRSAKLAWWTATLQLPQRWRLWRIARATPSCSPQPLVKAAVDAPVAPLPMPEASPTELPALPSPAMAAEPVDSLSKRVEEVELRTLGLETQRGEDGAQVAALLARLAALEQRTAGLDGLIEAERSRVDWALGEQEGVTGQIEAYHAYRETAAYQAAYATATPLVTVCVATMDRAGLLLERAIPSILAQTYRNLQILVVGDHCTDNTAECLAALGDDRIRFVNLPERGPYPRPGIDRWCVAGSNAMNHALSLAEGQFVTHLDDDDAMVPHRIETLLAAAQEDRADFLWHPFWYETGDGTWTRIGDGRLALGQVSTGSIFYHRYFTRFPWDVRAYRLREPGDWNRLRKISLLRPRLRFVDDMLFYHHAERSQAPFVAQPGERFLD